MARKVPFQLEYRKYEIPLKEGTRELGILGEIHVYTKRQSEFARWVVRGYDVIVEEQPHDGLLMGFAGLLHLPIVCAYVLRDARWYSGAKKIARELKKEIVPLEGGYSLPVGRQMALPVDIGWTLLSQPFRMIHEYVVGSSKSGDKTDSGAKMIATSDLEDFAVDMDFRDSWMAYRLAEQVRKQDKLVLAVCGRAHLEGIVRNLIEKQDLPLKEVLRESVP